MLLREMIQLADEKCVTFDDLGRERPKPAGGAREVDEAFNRLVQSRRSQPTLLLYDSVLTPKTGL